MAEMLHLRRQRMSRLHGSGMTTDPITNTEGELVMDQNTKDKSDDIAARIRREAADYYDQDGFTQAAFEVAAKIAEGTGPR